MDKAYINQWLLTATKGTVYCDFAWLADRMTLGCTVCGMSLTAPKPQDGHSMDYSVQEFVKIHAHTGGHESKPLETEWGSYNVHYTDLKELEAKVINVDDPKTSIPQELGAGWVSYKMSLGVSGPAPSVKMTNVKAPVIDDKPEKAKLIAEQMAKYDAEITAKMTDQAIANKVKILQMQDAEKAKLEAAKTATAFAQQAAQVEAMTAKEFKNYYSKDSVAKVKQNFQMFTYQPYGTSSGSYTEPQEPAAPPPVRRDKPLKRIEGRKFR